MTNLEKWRYYLKDFVSPDSFIDYGFYFLISAALQRRVWLGPPEKPIFPNLYVILVGDPGVGKGLVVKEVQSILTHHKLNCLTKTGSSVPTAPDGTKMLTEEDIEELRAEIAKNNGDKLDKRKPVEEPLLIPVAPDSLSGFESLVQYHAQCVRNISVPGKHPVFAPNGLYLYNSLVFCLEELSSLFKKHSEEIAKYLLNAYDCGDFWYKTKHCGEDRIKKLSLSFFAGTTPRFMQDKMEDGIVEDGLTARAIFVFEWANRFTKFILPPFTPEQIECKAEITAHVRKLATLFGQCTLSTEALKYLTNYCECILPVERINKDLRLNPYYGRKNQHLMKMCMAIHFADCVDSFEISLETAQKALEVLNHVEAKMHYALQFRSKSPIGDASKKVLKMLRQFGEMTPHEVWKGLEGDIGWAELQECIRYLTSTDQIESGLPKNGKPTYRPISKVTKKDISEAVRNSEGKSS